MGICICRCPTRGNSISRSVSNKNLIEYQEAPLRRVCVSGNAAENIEDEREREREREREERDRRASSLETIGLEIGLGGVDVV